MVMRLHELTPEQILHWRLARRLAGSKKYRDAHLQRYGLVDAAEEVQDLSNILHLAADRIRRQWSPESEVEREELFSELAAIHDDIDVLWDRIRRIDRMLPDQLCSDEQGGERVWWSEQERKVTLMTDLLIEAHRIIKRMLTAEQFLRDADPEAYKRAVKRNVREGQKWLERYSGEGDGE